jgi:hypothetical protein
MVEMLESLEAEQMALEAENAKMRAGLRVA